MIWISIAVTRFMGLLMMAAFLGDLAYHRVGYDSWAAVGYCAFTVAFWTAGDAMRWLEDHRD